MGRLFYFLAASEDLGRPFDPGIAPGKGGGGRAQNVLERAVVG